MSIAASASTAPAYTGTQTSAWSAAGNTVRRVPLVVWGCLRESRPSVQGIVALRFLAGASLASGGPECLAHLRVWVALGTWLAMYVAIYVFNGICDVEADRINNKQRPLAQGQITVPQALTVCFVLLAAAVWSAALLGTISLVCVVAVALAGIVYSWHPIPALAHPLLPLVSILLGGLGTYLVAGDSVGIDRWDGHVALLAAVMSCWMMLVGGQLKDLGDIQGDAAIGRRSAALTMGRSWAAGVGSACAVLLSVGMIGGAFLMGCDALLRAGVLLAVAATVISIRAVKVTRAGQDVDPQFARAPYRAFMGGQYGLHVLLLAPLGC